MNETEDASRFDCTILASHPNGPRVMISRQAEKEFWNLDTRQQARLAANMDLWTQGKVLTDKQLNPNEGRAKGTNRMLKAFKVYKIRCYGFECPISGKRTFVIIDVDPAKKSDKAKRWVLDRAKERMVHFEKTYGELYG